MLSDPSQDLCVATRDAGVDQDQAVKTVRLLERLDDLDDVQQVYSNLELTDEVLAEVG